MGSGPVRAPIPFPGRLRARETELFVSRAGELAAAERLVAHAARGDGGVICFEGEPGIGKTCLAAQIGVTASRNGAVVVYGRCDDQAGVPYQPFVEALGHYVQYAPADELPRRLEGLGALRRILPQLDAGEHDAVEPPRAAEGAAERFVLCGDVASFISSIAADAPLVLILDDLHWADESTVLMIRQVLERTTDARVAATLLWRGTEIGEEHPLHALLADLAHRPDAERLRLGGLGHEAVVECVGRELGDTDASTRHDIALAVLRRSSGNPLFVRELLRDIGERSAASELDAATGQGLPDSIRAVVRDRVTRLGPAARRVLEAASCVGATFDAPLLAACIDVAPADVEQALDRARSAGLLAETGAWPGALGFVHVLVEDALYELQPQTGRGHIHRRLAEALERGGSHRELPDPSLIARHWLRAVPGDDARAAFWARRAGDRALSALAPQDAVAWYDEALAILERRSPDGLERCEALCGLGEAQRDIGEGGFRETLLEATRLALKLGSTPLAIRAAAANNRGFASRTGEVDEERMALLEEVLRIAPDGDHGSRAQLLATLAAELSFGGDFDRRAAVADDALDAARRSGDAATLSRTLSARFVPLWSPETLDQRLDDTQEAVRQAVLSGSPTLQFEAVHWRAAGLIEAARLDDARAAAHRQDELAERIGQPTALWLSTYDRANLALIGGRLHEAEQLAERALAIALESRQPDALPFYASQLANIRYEQGRLGEMQELIAQIVAAHPGIPAFRAVLALACVEADLLHDAAVLLDSEAGDEFARLPKDVTRMPALAIWGDVCSRVGEAAVAELLYDLLAPWHGHIAFTGVGSWSTVAHVLGRLAARLERHAEALDHLAEAIERYERIGAPVWVARAQVDEAEVRVARDAAGDRARARDLVDLAGPAASRLDAAAVERRATALSRRLRSLELLSASGQEAAASRGHQAPARPPALTRQDAAATSAAPAAGSPDNGLTWEGDVWTVRHGERSFRLADGRGLRHLARLLASPGIDIAAIDLAAGAPERGRAISAGAEGLTVRGPGDSHAGALLDERAKREYRTRLTELREELAEAEAFNDPERSSRAREELDFLARELAGAVGLGGRDRVAGATAERARVNVTRAVRKTIARIADHDADLGRELGAAVRTGAFCRFDPAGASGSWHVELPR